MEHRPLHAAIRKPPKRVLLEREIVEITRREKERIGRELHDGLCQSLAGIAALSSALSRDLAANADPAASATAAEIARLLNEAIGQTRDPGARPWRRRPGRRRPCRGSPDPGGQRAAPLSRFV